MPLVLALLLQGRRLAEHVHVAIGQRLRDAKLDGALDAFDVVREPLLDLAGILVADFGEESLQLVVLEGL